MGCTNVCCIVQYCILQCSAILYSKIPCVVYSAGAVQYSRVLYSTIQESTVQYNTVEYYSVQYRRVQYSTIPHTVRCCPVLSPQVIIPVVYKPYSERRSFTLCPELCFAKKSSCQLSLSCWQLSLSCCQLLCHNYQLFSFHHFS